ncbi:unnamed protein product, partial [Tuber aestivum]
GWQPEGVHVPVLFEKPEEAGRAYKMLPERKLGNPPVRLSWKTPNTIVYIMNISPETSSARIRQLLQGYQLHGALVRRPHMMIAAFRNPEEAEMAVRRLQGTSVDGELLQFSVLQDQHASEFVGYDHSLSCYMCLRTLKSGTRTVSIIATPPLPLSLAVESPAYYELTFNLGKRPQITLCDSRELSTATHRDIALRIRHAGQAAGELGPHPNAGHFLRFMEEVFRRDVADSGGIMDVGIVLKDPLDKLEVEAFLGGSVPPASRVVRGIGRELRPRRWDTAGESSGIRENGRQRGNALHSGALSKPGPSRRASTGGASNQPAWPGVDDMPLGKGVNMESKPHGSANTKGPGSKRVLLVGVTKSEHSSPGHPPPGPGGASGVSVFSDPKLKVRRFPFFSTQPTAMTMRPLIFGQRQRGSRLFPSGGENTLVGQLGGGEGLRDSDEVGMEAFEDQGGDAPPEQVDGEGNGISLSEPYIKRSSSDSASSSWSFLHRSYNDRAISSPSLSSAPAGSVGESVTQAFSQMQYTDDSGSEATESAPAEIVDLTLVDDGEEGKPEKLRNPGKEKRNVPIVDSSGDDGQSGLGLRVVVGERSTRKRKKSKRKEKVLSDNCMALESGNEQLMVQRRERKSGKKGKGKEIAHSDRRMEFQSDWDEPGPSKPREKSGSKKISEQVESASGYESPALSKVKRKGKKKKTKEMGEVRECSDVDMDSSDPLTKRTREKRRSYQSSVPELTEGVAETPVASGRSTSRRSKPSASTSSSDPKTKKRKRNRSPSTDLSSSPARSVESMDASSRRREIEKQLSHINLQQHKLSVRESGLMHELKKLKYEARRDADLQGVEYANCTCSACGEYGHNKRNRLKCKAHELYRDWYPER